MSAHQLASKKKRFLVHVVPVSFLCVHFKQGLLVAGGGNWGTEPLSSTELFLPSKNKWLKGKELPRWKFQTKNYVFHQTRFNMIISQKCPFVKLVLVQFTKVFPRRLWYLRAANLDGKVVVTCGRDMRQLYTKGLSIEVSSTIKASSTTKTHTHIPTYPHNYL